MAKGDFKALKQFTVDLRVMQAETRNKLLPSMVNRLAGEMLRDVQKTTPVQTGNLRRSWRANPCRGTIGGKATADVTNNAAYASYVELGHRTSKGGVPGAGWVEGQFFMQNAENTLSQNAPRICSQMLTDYLHGKGFK